MGFFRPDTPVELVTTAGVDNHADLVRRRRTYVTVMGFRTLCVLLSVVLPLPIWARLLIMAGGIFLPLFAVTGANGGPAAEQREAALLPHEMPQVRELTPQHAMRPADAVIIDGVSVVVDTPEHPAPVAPTATARRPVVTLEGEVVAG